GPTLRGRAHVQLGDLALLDGADLRAEREYQAAIALPAEESSARLTTVKLMLAHPHAGESMPAIAARQALLRYLLPPPATRDEATRLDAADWIARADFYERSRP